MHLFLLFRSLLGPKTHRRNSLQRLHRGVWYPSPCPSADFGAAQAIVAWRWLDPLSVWTGKWTAEPRLGIHPGWKWLVHLYFEGIAEECGLDPLNPFDCQPHLRSRKGSMACSLDPPALDVATGVKTWSRPEHEPTPNKDTSVPFLDRGSLVQNRVTWEQLQNQKVTQDFFNIQ